MARHDPHPDPERLAEYAEGALVPQERETVERHLADCAACRGEVVETAMFMQSEATTAPVAGGVAGRVLPFRAQRWAIAGAAVAAAAALVVAIRVLGPRGDRPELHELIAVLAAEPTRPVEARLTGGFRYAPRPTAMRGDGDVSPDLRIAAAKIEKLANASDTAAHTADLGTTFLVTGDPDRAVRSLEESVARDPQNANWLSDLAAAYLEQGRRGRREAYASAVDTAHRALNRNENLPEAWFNLALGLEGLRLADDAKVAWSRYLRLDNASPWADEAREHLATPPASALPPASTLQTDLRLAIAGGSVTDLENVIARSTARSLDFFEMELLPSWARSQRVASEPEQASLAQLRAFAVAFERATGDALLRDAVENLDRPPGQRRALASAFARYSKARSMYESDRAGDAVALFARAASTFDAVASPFRLWTDFYNGLRFYYAGQADAAINVFTALGNEAASHNYQLIGGRASWMIGLLQVTQSKLTESLQSYATALRMLSAARDREGVAAVHSLVADSLELLGDDTEAFRERMTALDQLDAYASFRRRHTILKGLAQSQAAFAPDLALHFQTALVGNAVAWSRPAAVVEARLGEAKIALEQGATDRADRALDAAQRTLSDVIDQAFIVRLSTEIAIRRGELIAAREPWAAEAALDEAASQAPPNGLGFQRPNLYRLKGHAQRSVGRIGDAEGSYLESMRLLSAQWPMLQGDSLRVEAAQHLWDLACDVMRLEIENRQRAFVGLSFVDQFRGLTRDEASFAIAPPADPAWTIPDRTAVVAYVVLRDRTYVWAIANGLRRFALLPTPSRELEQLAAQHGRAIQQSRDSERPRELGETLYAVLVAPVQDVVDAVQTVIIVPDGGLNRVAFAALVNPRTHRFLIESHDVGIAPSVGEFVGRSTAPASASAQALVIGDPEHDDDGSRYLPLPGARTEALSIGALYQHAEIVTGSDATKQRFVDALPRSTVVHFAGHAVVNANDPFRSRLLLAPSDGAPGVLYAEEIGRLRLKPGTVVVLAACESAAGRLVRGQGAINLARPFLIARAGAVVATLWRLNDRISEPFFVELHRRLRENTPVAAVSQTQRTFLSNQDSSLRQIQVWAGVEAIGTTHASRTN